jgi:hypothetical protein
MGGGRHSFLTSLTFFFDLAFLTFFFVTFFFSTLPFLLPSFLDLFCYLHSSLHSFLLILLFLLFLLPFSQEGAAFTPTTQGSLRQTSRLRNPVCLQCRRLLPTTTKMCSSNERCRCPYRSRSVSAAAPPFDSPPPPPSPPGKQSWNVGAYIWIFLYVVYSITSAGMPGCSSAICCGHTSNRSTSFVFIISSAAVNSVGVQPLYVVAVGLAIFLIWVQLLRAPG